MAEPSRPRWRKLTHYGPIQLCNALDLFQWQFERALQAGLIPEREAVGWPAPMIDALRGRAEGDQGGRRGGADLIAVSLPTGRADGANRRGERL
ncbi:hypothetical protein [Nonomuraea fuscirosea]|uniref:hypothetical protein n=1 Tax=Nonomuraea fuscirosea TaxID=1291556 RepID=UPI0033F45D47